MESESVISLIPEVLGMAVMVVELRGRSFMGRSCVRRSCMGWSFIGWFFKSCGSFGGGASEVSSFGGYD